METPQATSPVTAPAPAALPVQPQPTAPTEPLSPASTGEGNTNVQDFIEVDGRRPAAPAETKPADQSGKYKDLSEANKGYDELYKLYTQAAGRTANTVEKLEKVLSDLPTQLAQNIAQLLTQSKAPEPPKAEAPKPPAQPESLLKLSIDDITDPEQLARVLSSQLQPHLAKPAPLDEAKLIEGLAPKINQLVEKTLADREEATLRTRAQTEIKEIVDQGFDPALVESAVLYGIKNQKNSVPEAWKFFQQKFPQIFAQQKAESIIGELAGQRQQLPRDLGNGVTVSDENSLRNAFSKVRDYKFASNELL